MGEASMRKWERHAREFFPGESLSEEEARRRGVRMRRINRVCKRWGMSCRILSTRIGGPEDGRTMWYPRFTVTPEMMEVSQKTAYSVVTIPCETLEEAAARP